MTLVLIAVLIAIAAVLIAIAVEWQAIRDWFKDSETIVWARLQVLGGILLAGLNVMNWGPLLDTGLTAAQRWTLAGTLAIQGLITELARRFRATDM